jgi:hypothetical protein
MSSQEDEYNNINKSHTDDNNENNNNYNSRLYNSPIKEKKTPNSENKLDSNFRTYSNETKKDSFYFESIYKELDDKLASEIEKHLSHIDNNSLTQSPNKTALKVEGFKLNKGLIRNGKNIIDRMHKLVVESDNLIKQIKQASELLVIKNRKLYSKNSYSNSKSDTGGEGESSLKHILEDLVFLSNTLKERLTPYENMHTHDDLNILFISKDSIDPISQRIFNLPMGRQD